MCCHFNCCCFWSFCFSVVIVGSENPTLDKIGSVMLLLLVLMLLFLLLLLLLLRMLLLLLIPPYYSRSFFDIIREVKEDLNINPIHLTVKQWYTVILEKFVTTRVIDDEGRRELVPNRIEERSPHIQFDRSYHLARLHGFSPCSKSFLFKLLHQLLPFRERVSRLIPGNSPLCWCNSGNIETYMHCFFVCLIAVRQQMLSSDAPGVMTRT